MSDDRSRRRPGRLRIVAFDLDGTLVDSVGDLAASLNRALGELGAGPLPVAQVRGFVGNGAVMLVARAVAASGKPLDHDDVLRRFRAHYDRALVDETRPFAGVVEALGALRERGLRLAVATNKPGPPARALVQALLPGLFDVVLGPDDVGGALKPEAAMLRRIGELLAGDVVAFVGDSGVDVATARNAGVRCVGVAWGLRPEEVAGADVVVQAPRELVGALAQP